MIYFSAAPVHIDSVDTEQYNKLRAFKEELRARGLVDEYEDLTAFRTNLTRHLAKKSLKPSPQENMQTIRTIPHSRNANPFYPSQPGTCSLRQSMILAGP